MVEACKKFHGTQIEDLDQKQMYLIQIKQKYPEMSLQTRNVFRTERMEMEA